jgi:cytosine/adenosine deaminase-related metal-dependent hydrolase
MAWTWRAASSGPGPLDAHTHLDKGHIWPRMRNADGTFAGAIAAVMSDRGAAWSEEDIATRAGFSLRSAYAHGTVAIRTHLDTYLPHGMTTWRVFRRLREEWAGRVDLQMSSICPLDRFTGPDGKAIADMVAASGGILGMVTRHTGSIHDELPASFQEELDHFFSLAEERGLDLDLHVDESGETGRAGAARDRADGAEAKLQGPHPVRPLLLPLHPARGVRAGDDRARGRGRDRHRRPAHVQHVPAGPRAGPHAPLARRDAGA